nr:immunoglobulin heavy chain junction region [Mus musculus]MBK4196517.1 immunoglobulin heavy chain junction region [Mus musculus]MBK4196518.1 immunoglobulin heavy chain junction region [Mus musculus]
CARYSLYAMDYW